MFNDLLNETITIKYPTGAFADGEAAREECQAKAFVFDYNERQLKEIGMVSNAKFFVIAANAGTIAAFTVRPLGTTITHEGRNYDVKSVRSCRNLDGEIECFSCAGV